LSGEQIGMTRTPEGQLRVQGVVDTEERKREILNSLSSVLGNRAVSVEIVTPAEVVNQQSSKSSISQSKIPSSPTTVEGISAARDTIPVDAEVRRFFTGQGMPADRIDEEIRRFSRRVLNRSRRIRLHAVALKQVVERFSSADLQTLDQVARAKWRAMIAEHARGVQQESIALRRDLEPIFPGGVAAAAATGSGMRINDDRELAQAVSRLYQLASGCDEGVSFSFSVAAVSQPAAPVRSAQFWSSLKSAEALAEKIAQIQ
jgi:hypothetical protein